jgi:hypothetical protein
MNDSWLSIFALALGAADTEAAPDEISAEIVALAEGNRSAVEAARVHSIASFGGERDAHRATVVLGYLDLALRRGDNAHRWHRNTVDPWSVATG